MKVIGEVLTDAEIAARKAAAERFQDADYLTGIYPEDPDHDQILHDERWHCADEDL